MLRLSLTKERTLLDHIKHTLETEAINLLIAVRIGYTTEQIKEITQKIATIGAALQ